MNTVRNEGITEGKAAGIIEGKKAKSLEIAKKMFEMKSDIEFITEVTGLTKSEIENLK